MTVLIFSALLLVSACAQQDQQSESDQQPPVSDSPPQTVIFCPDCQLVEVTGMVDGDTINTSIGRVRFFGVDTPERGDSCYSEATEFTRLLVGSQVRIEDGPRFNDSFGRRLAYVYDPSGNSIDVQLVAGGFATAWTRDGQHKDMLVGLEATARSNSAGCLWSSTDEPSTTDTESQLSAFDPIEHLANFIVNRELATTHVFGLTDADGDEVYIASGRLGLPTRRNTSTWLAEELDHGAWIIDTDGEIWEVYDSAARPMRLWP